MNNFEQINKLNQFIETKREKITPILESTTKVIEEYGIQSLTFDLVGKKCKMTPAHVNYYFKNKDELIKATVLYVMKKSRSYFDLEMKTKSKKPKVEVMIQANFDWFRNFPNYRSIDVCFDYLASIDGEMAKVFLEHKESGAYWMATLSAEFANKPIDKTLGLLIHNLVSGYLQQYCSLLQTKQPVSKFEKNTIETCLRVIESWYSK